MLGLDGSLVFLVSLHTQNLLLFVCLFVYTADVLDDELMNIWCLCLVGACFLGGVTQHTFYPGVW